MQSLFRICPPRGEVTYLQIDGHMPATQIEYSNGGCGTIGFLSLSLCVCTCTHVPPHIMNLHDTPILGFPLLIIVVDLKINWDF